jgi:hypothetical protein
MMPREITDIEVLQAYLRGVMERAEHHAGDVSDIALTLAGAIIWRKDSGAIKVREHEGQLANVLWTKIGGEQYAFSYNHKDKTIEIRRGNIRGEVLRSFTNSTTAAEVKQFFSEL